MEVREPDARGWGAALTQQTDIGQIPMDWSVKPLSALSERIMVGIANAATHAYREKGVLMFRNQNIKNGVVDTEDVLFIDPVFEQTYRNKRLKAGDLLTARTGYPGATAVVPADCEGAQSFTTLITRPKPSGIDAKYLCYFINGSAGQRFFEQAQIGGGQKNVNAASLKQLPVGFPTTLAEQQVIAEALSDADALIESLSLLLAKKRQIKQGAMQELLTGKKRLPGFVATWGSVTIGSFTDCTAGGTPSTNIETYWGGDIPWMSSGDLHMKHVRDVEGRITEEGLRNSSTKWIPAGCVLIGLAGQGKTRGTVAINHVPLCTNQSIAAIFPVDSYDSLFLYFNLESRYEELRELSAGDGGRGGLNLSLIRSLSVPMPCLNEQREIARVLTDLDSDIASIEEKLAKAYDIKQGMMQTLLTGRIRLLQPATNVIPLPTKPAANLDAAQPTHNWQINEAVVIGVLAQHFGSEQFPLPRKRRVKLTYLLHRHAEGRAEGYLKKAAGPYNPRIKYSGPEQIALKNGYVRALRNDKYEGFVAGDKIGQARRYFEQWYGAATLEWLERFHYRKTDDLELLATVDMAMVDLAASGESVDVASVKRIIAAHPEWLPKLSRELFADERIAAAIAECGSLFPV